MADLYIHYSALTEQQEALAGGEDGKPDLYSRKACNYLEQAVAVIHIKKIGTE